MTTAEAIAAMKAVAAVKAVTVREVVAAVIIMVIDDNIYRGCCVELSCQHACVVNP